jgi:hypothetical protein
VNLLLIGQSRWSEKVSKSIKFGLSWVNTRTIGARHFLGNPKIADSLAPDLVWVVCRPNLQPHVIESLSGFTGIVIIEKPIGLSTSDFAQLEKSNLYSSGKLRLSRPWNYSAVWHTYKSLIGKNISYLKIVRGGLNHSSSIPSHLDWLPHDLFLLTDLFGESMLSCKLENISIEDELLKAKIMIEDLNIMVNLESGKLNEQRIAMWDAVNYQGMHSKIDFTSNQIVLSESRVITPPIEMDAICKMITNLDTVTQSDVKLDIAVQKRICKEILTLA